MRSKHIVPFDVNRYKNDILSFAEDQYFLTPGKRIKLWDFQKDILKQITARNADGEYVYDLDVISLPRQCSKSEISAIAGVHSLFTSGYGTEQITVAVGGKGNAAIIFDKAKRAIRNNPALYALVGDRNFLKNEISVPSTDSQWVIAPSRNITGTGILGRAYRLIMIDELGHDEYDDMSRVMDALSGGQAAISEDARIIVTSTVGQQTGKLWELFELSKSDPGIFLYYSTENLSPKIKASFLRRQQRRLHPAIFAMYHRNQWFSSEYQFLSRGQWDAATSIEWHPAVSMPAGTSAVQFVDIGIVKDASVVASVYKVGDEIRLAEIKSWQGSKAKPVQIQAIADYLTESHSRLNVRRVGIDSSQAEYLAQSLSRKFAVESIPITMQWNVKMWGNLLMLMQNNRLRLFSDRTEDMIQMEREALNLLIEPKGASFKVTDPGKLHQDRIFTVAAAAYLIDQRSADGKFSASQLRPEMFETAYSRERDGYYDRETEEYKAMKKEVVADFVRARERRREG